MTQVARFDTNALNRALIGFDQLFDTFETRFANQLSNNYPPYNIEKVAENLYDIVVAVAGFSKEEVSVEVEGDQLTKQSILFQMLLVVFVCLLNSL